MANYPKPVKGSRYGRKGEGRPNVRGSSRINHNAGVRTALREDRRVQAKVRQEAYNKLSPAEKLLKLDVGGHTAVSQRIKLAAALLPANQSVVEAKPKKAKKAKTQAVAA